MMDHARVSQMKTEDALSLPEDVLIEFLIYLPVRPLIRFKCISRFWCDLIKSPDFVARHLQRDGEETILMKRYIPGDIDDSDVAGDDVFTFHNPDNPELLVSQSISLSFFTEVFDVQWARYCLNVHGPCNGIICLDCRDATVFSNPALREFRLLDSCPIACPEGYISCRMYRSGFGFDAKTNSYKLVKLQNIGDIEKDIGDDDIDDWIRIDLYDSRSNSWKIIDDVVPEVHNRIDFNLLFNGAYHWHATKSHEHPVKGTILSFDMSNEIFRTFQFPSCEDCTINPSLVVVSKCLAVINHGGFYNKLGSADIWVMKEYGVEESWTKELVIGPYLFTFPLLCLKNKWLLVESKECELASCALHRNDMKRLQQFQGDEKSFRALMFKESLVSVKHVFIGTEKISLN